MEKNQEQLSWEAFSKRFTLVQNPFNKEIGFSGALFNIAGPELEMIKEASSAHVWSLMYDIDTDSNFVMSGYMTANRSLYLITEEPVAEDTLFHFKPPW